MTLQAIVFDFDGVIADSERLHLRAYQDVLLPEGVTLTDQGRLIATYALCGFANFSSIAIQIGGIGGLAPERRADLARFGLRAVLGGSLATFMTATIAGVLSRFA